MMWRNPSSIHLSKESALKNVLYFLWSKGRVSPHYSLRIGVPEFISIHIISLSLALALALAWNQIGRKPLTNVLHPNSLRGCLRALIAGCRCESNDFRESLLWWQPPDEWPVHFWGAGGPGLPPTPGRNWIVAGPLLGMLTQDSHSSLIFYLIFKLNIFS